MTEIHHHEDRVYTTEEVCDILARGVGAEALAAWPLVALPGYVIEVARIAAAEPDPIDQAELEEALRPRRGLRTEWGLLVVDLRELHVEDAPGWVLQMDGFLADDPYLELPHLRRKPGETAGIYLSDLANGLIEGGPASTAALVLSAMGMEWADNDKTGQLVQFIGFDEPGQHLDFAALGALLADWLRKAEIGRVLHCAGSPDVLGKVSETDTLPITRAVLH